MLQGYEHTHTPTHTHVAQASGSRSVSETQSGSERAAAGAMGWAGPYGEQRGAGGRGGRQGDPERGAACLIGAHLHSSGAGDT